MRKGYRVSASAHVGRPAEEVYSILADYKEGHPRILPRNYFTSLEVERGGRGEGTVIRFRMRVLGREYTSRAVITEPEPGRVLVETVFDPGGVVTTFLVEPSGQDSRVTITTEMSAAGGLPGLAERVVTTALLRRVYAQELELLDRFARERSRRVAETAAAGA